MSWCYRVFVFRLSLCASTSTKLKHGLRLWHMQPTFRVACVATCVFHTRPIHQWVCWSGPEECSGAVFSSRQSEMDENLEFFLRTSCAEFSASGCNLPCCIADRGLTRFVISDFLIELSGPCRQFTPWWEQMGGQDGFFTQAQAQENHISA